MFRFLSFTVNEKYLSLQLTDANNTGKLIQWEKEHPPFILIKYDSCRPDRNNQKLWRRQIKNQEYSNFIQSRILTSIWDNHQRKKRQINSNLCHLEPLEGIYMKFTRLCPFLIFNQSKFPTRFSFKKFRSFLSSWKLTKFAVGLQKDIRWISDRNRNTNF